VAPSPTSRDTIGSAGESRMSSVSGLKVKPSTAIVLPRTVPPQALIKIGGQLQWPPYGGTLMFTNIGVDNRILRNQWVKIAEYLKWESIPGMSKDGIWRAWVNGVLTMNYTDRTFPDLVGIAEFQFSMTRQMPVSLDERAWVDHTIVRGR
jgi:hypothetical protein